MNIDNIKNYYRGWIIGNFEPSLIKTKLFEIALLQHKKNEKWSKHFHKVATEYNVLISGKMIVCDKEINTGDIFVLEKNEIADPVFLEDCIVLCIKIPSVPGDKYIIYD